MSGISEELALSIGLKTTSFEEGAQTVVRASEKIDKSIEAIGGGLAGGALVEWIKSTVEGAAKLEHFSKNVGASTDALQALNFMARENSVAQEETNRVWTSSKLALDKLQDGLPTMVHDFALLGLTVQDFQGLSLDESLQKIAAAYVENENHAGAYQALQAIVGRTGRDLTGVLVELGEKGFGSMIASAKEAHAITDGQTLKDLTELNKRFEEEANLIKKGGVEIVWFIQGIASTMGATLGFFEKLAEAQLNLIKTGNLSDYIRDIKSAGQGWHATMLEITDSKEETTKTTGAVKEMLPPLVANKDQIAEQKREMAEANRIANEQLGTLIKIYESELKHQTLYEQRLTLQRELKTLEALLVEAKIEGLDTTKLENDLIATRTKIEDNELNLTNAKLKAEGDLLSTDKQIVATALVHLDIMSGKLTQLKAQRDAEELLARGANNLTDTEKSHLVALVDQLTPMQKQQEIAEIMKRAVIDTATGAITLTEADKADLAVLTGKTEEMQKQLKISQSLHDLAHANITSFAGIEIGKPHSVSDLANVSDDVLQEMIRRNDDKIAQLEAGKAGTGVNGATYAAELASGFLNRSLAEGQISMDNEAIRSVLQQRLGLQQPRSLALSSFQGDLSQFDQSFSSAANQMPAQLDLIHQVLATLDARLSTILKKG